MAYVNTNTLSKMLSGLVTLDGSSVKMFITRESLGSLESKNTLADFTTPDFFSNSVTVTAINSNTGMVYLSAYEVYFTNITIDYSAEYNVYFVTYIDSGTPSTSPVLTVDTKNLPNISGPTFYNYNSRGILYLSDVDLSRCLFRNFSEQLMKGTLGDLGASNIKLALMDSTYNAVFDIATHKHYSDISSHVVATQAVNGAYVSTAKSLRTTDPYISFPNLTGSTVEGLVFYIDTGVASTSTLMCYYYGPGYISNIPYTPNGSTVTVKTFGDVIFQL